MLKVYIPLQQAWGTIDEAVKYFEDLIKDLKFLQTKPGGEPTELFLEVAGSQETGFEIVLQDMD